MDVVRSWFRRHLANPQIVSLAVVLAVALLTITWFGTILSPLLAALVFAYLLEGPVAILERHH